MWSTIGIDYAQYHSKLYTLARTSFLLYINVYFNEKFRIIALTTGSDSIVTHFYLGYCRQHLDCTLVARPFGKYAIIELVNPTQKCHCTQTVVD